MSLSVLDQIHHEGEIRLPFLWFFYHVVVDGYQIYFVIDRKSHFYPETLLIDL